MLVLSLVGDVQVGVVTAVVLTGAVAVTAGTMGNAAAVAARDVLLGAIMDLGMLLKRRLNGSSGLRVLGEVGSALGEMLLLPGGVLCADLVAEETLDRHALFLCLVEPFRTESALIFIYRQQQAVYGTVTE